MCRRKTWLLAVFITALGFALRVAAVTDFWINADEGIYDRIAHAPPATAQLAISLNAHPPAYYGLLRGIASVSDDFVWLRVPSLIFGCLSIFAMYLLGREVAGTGCGIAAALATALSPGAIMMSQVARPYALQGFLIVCALLFFFRYLRGRGRRNLWSYVACILTSLLVHYGSILPLGGMGSVFAILVLAGRFDSSEIRDLVIAHAALLAIALLLFALHVGPSLSGNAIRLDAVTGWLADQFIAGPGDAWRNLLGVFDYLAGTRFGLVTAVAFLAGLAVCLVDRRSELAGLCATVLIAAVALSALGLYPFGGTRHSFHLAPLVALVVAVGIGRAITGGAWAVALGSVVATMLVLAAGPAKETIGPNGDREGPLRELEIPRRELEVLKPSIEAIKARAGILIVDNETVNTLSPLLRAARVQRRLLGTPPISAFPWGRRQVVIHPAWNMLAGLEGNASARHLSLLLLLIGRVPELAPLLDEDVRVLSSNGAFIPAAIRALPRGGGRRSALVEDLVQTPHFSLFRLNSVLYQRVLQGRQ